jgi:hypothetical protein
MKKKASYTMTEEALAVLETVGNASAYLSALVVERDRQWRTALTALQSQAPAPLMTWMEDQAWMLNGASVRDLQDFAMPSDYRDRAAAVALEVASGNEAVRNACLGLAPARTAPMRAARGGRKHG